MLVRKYKKQICIIVLILLIPFIVPVLSVIIDIILNVGRYFGTLARYISMGVCCLKA